MESDWLSIISGHDILVYSVWLGLNFSILLRQINISDSFLFFFSQKRLKLSPSLRGKLNEMSNIIFFEKLEKKFQNDVCFYL